MRTGKKGLEVSLNKDCTKRAGRIIRICAVGTGTCKVQEYRQYTRLNMFYCNHRAKGKGLRAIVINNDSSLITVLKILFYYVCTMFIYAQIYALLSVIVSS